MHTIRRFWIDIGLVLIFDVDRSEMSAPATRFDDLETITLLLSEWMA